MVARLIDVGARGDERIDDVVEAVLRGQVERRLAKFPDGVDVNAGGEQRVDLFKAALVGCVDEIVA